MAVTIGGAVKVWLYSISPGALLQRVGKWLWERAGDAEIGPDGLAGGHRWQYALVCGPCLSWWLGLVAGLAGAFLCSLWWLTVPVLAWIAFQELDKRW